MYYNDIDDYFQKFRERKLDNIRRNSIRRYHVPRLLFLTNFKVHLTSKDLRVGQRYLFVYNQNNGKPTKKFKAEFVDVSLNPKYGHMIDFKNMTKNEKGEPDENGTIIDKTLRQLPTKSLTAYLIEKK